MNSKHMEVAVELTLADELAVELNDTELDQIAGGNVWTYTDNGKMCDGPVYVS